MLKVTGKLKKVEILEGGITLEKIKLTSAQCAKFKDLENEALDITFELVQAELPGLTPPGEKSDGKGKKNKKKK